MVHSAERGAMGGESRLFLLSRSIATARTSLRSNRSSAAPVCLSSCRKQKTQQNYPLILPLPHAVQQSAKPRRADSDSSSSCRGIDRATSPFASINTYTDNPSCVLPGSLIPRGSTPRVGRGGVGRLQVSE